MRKTVNTSYGTIVIGDREIDRSFNEDYVLVKFVDGGRAKGFTIPETLKLAAILIESVNEIQQSRD